MSEEELEDRLNPRKNPEWLKELGREVKRIIEEDSKLRQEKNLNDYIYGGCVVKVFFLS